MWASYCRTNGAERALKRHAEVYVCTYSPGDVHMLVCVCAHAHLKVCTCSTEPSTCWIGDAWTSHFKNPKLDRECRTSSLQIPPVQLSRNCKQQPHFLYSVCSCSTVFTAHIFPSGTDLMAGVFPLEMHNFFFFFIRVAGDSAGHMQSYPSKWVWHYHYKVCAKYHFHN